MRIFSIGFWENMTSCDTDDIIPGKIRDLTRTVKSSVHYIGFLSNFQKNLIVIRVVAV